MTLTVTTTGNKAPTVALSAPVNASSVELGTAVTLSASAADADGAVSRVGFYGGSTLLGSATTTSTAATLTVTAAAGVANLAPSATLATSYVSPWESLAAVNNNIVPVNSLAKTGGAYGNWRNNAYYDRTEWVSFTWVAPRTISSFEVYWWNDGKGIATPTVANVQHWNGSAWVTLGAPGRALNTFNRLNFAAVTTTSVRVSMRSTKAMGILEARVWGC